MAYPLRQSTASQEIPLGPFLDDTDGKTAETGLTIANTDIKLWKHGSSSAVNKNSGGATHDTQGNYVMTLDATDTNTVGGLVIAVHVSGALPCRIVCNVLPANVFDSLILGSDLLDVNATAGGGSPAPPSLTEIIEGLMGQDLSALTESAMPKKSLYAALAKLVHKVTSVGGTMSVYRSNGSTVHYTQTETEDAAANPLTGLGGAS